MRTRNFITTMMKKLKRQKIIKTTYNERYNYYNYFTHKEWGDRNDFDLMIDTSKIGVDGAVELIKRYVELKNNQ